MRHDRLEVARQTASDPAVSFRALIASREVGRAHCDGGRLGVRAATTAKARAIPLSSPGGSGSLLSMGKRVEVAG